MFTPSVGECVKYNAYTRHPYGECSEIAHNDILRVEACRYDDPKNPERYFLNVSDGRDRIWWNFHPCEFEPVHSKPINTFFD